MECDLTDLVTEHKCIKLVSFAGLISTLQNKNVRSDRDVISGYFRTSPHVTECN